MAWLFTSTSAWLLARLAPWKDRDPVPRAPETLAADASTLDRLGRSLP